MRGLFDIKSKLITPSIFIIGIIFLVGACNTHSYFGRWMTWRASDIMDYEKFPAIYFQSSDEPFIFTKVIDHTLDSFFVSIKKEKKQLLKQVLKNSETTAFIVIRNDTLICEDYFNGYSRESINTSFSVAKSITSLMIGKAIEEGIIDSKKDPITDYLPEFSRSNPGYSKITISHLLNMRSGIQFKDHDLPWGDKPKAYYHPRLRERIKKLPIKFESGSKFQYNPYNTIMVGMILEKVSNLPPAIYFEEKIWNKLGMEFPGSWSLDSDESKMTKMESGLNIRAIDFAKLGRLVLNMGNWNGEQIISRKWMEDCQALLPENKAPEIGDKIYYNNFWWLFSKDNEKTYSISGWGHLGQFLYIFPHEKIIILRLGKDIGKVDSWSNVFQEIVDNVGY